MSFVLHTNIVGMVIGPMSPTRPGFMARYQLSAAVKAPGWPSTRRYSSVSASEPAVFSIMRSRRKSSSPRTSSALPSWRKSWMYEDLSRWSSLSDSAVAKAFGWGTETMFSVRSRS